MGILCATNFSPEAITATTVAAELARQRKEALTLVFVMPGHIARNFGREVLLTAEEALELEAARARELGATVTASVLIGKLARELPRFVSAHQIGLVIVGDTHREAGFLGTATITRLGQHLEAPLWVVRESERVIAWARGQRPLKVMIGLDQTLSTEIAARWLEKLSAYGPLEVLGGHIFWPPVEYQRFGLPLPHAWDEENPELIAALHRELVGKLPASLRARLLTKPAIGRVSDHLSALAANQHVDLLVLGTHHHRALGKLWSVSEQCLQSAPVSVVCVPATRRAIELEPAVARVDRVLIATDFTPTGDLAVAWGLGILEPGGTADLVHVSVRALSAEGERQILERLRSRVPREVERRGVTVNAHALVNPSPANAIVAASERFTSAVICLGARARAGLSKVLGSTAQAVFAGSQRPVLLVRPPER